MQVLTNCEELWDTGQWVYTQALCVKHLLLSIRRRTAGHANILPPLPPIWGKRSPVFWISCHEVYTVYGKTGRVWKGGVAFPVLTISFRFRAGQGFWCCPVWSCTSGVEASQQSKTTSARFRLHRDGPAVFRVLQGHALGSTAHKCSFLLSDLREISVRHRLEADTLKLSNKHYPMWSPHHRLSVENATLKRMGQGLMEHVFIPRSVSKRR